MKVFLKEFVSELLKHICPVLLWVVVIFILGIIAFFVGSKVNKFINKK